MTELLESVNPPVPPPGPEKCILCGETHQEKKQDELSPVTYSRNDNALTDAGRAFIKSDSERAAFYPTDENGGWVSPLTAPEWDAETTFSTYLAGGKQKARAEKYQPPPIKGWIAAPHHMVAVCCMNGANKLPGKPKINPWAKKGGYDINGGGNCIFLPSSASQFFVAYYLARKRGKGKPLQGHLGAHRKVYFETVWSMLERTARLLKAEGMCNKTDSDADKDTIAKAVNEEVHILEGTLFRKIANRSPEPQFKLGADSYIEIPADGEDMNSVRAKIQPYLQSYETLPNWY